MRRNYVLVLMAVLVVLLLACGKSPSNQTAEKPATPMPGYAASGTPTTRAAIPGATTPGALPITASATTVPAGEHIVIRLGETISSKRNNSGDSFSGTVAQPVSVNGRVVIPQGATAAGTVTEAKPLGRFKGGAVLRIVLNSVNVNGKNYNIETAAITRTLKGKGKRTAVAIGGGAGLGAIIGGIAGGGKGAAIGAVAGAGAGTAGAAFTGNKDIVLPAERAISFRLLQPLNIR